MKNFWPTSWCAGRNCVSRAGTFLPKNSAEDCPHLADELARRINALKVTSWLDKRPPIDVSHDPRRAGLAVRRRPRTWPVATGSTT